MPVTSGVFESAYADCAPTRNPTLATASATPRTHPRARTCTPSSEDGAHPRSGATSPREPTQVRWDGQPGSLARTAEVTTSTLGRLVLPPPPRSDRPTSTA